MGGPLSRSPTVRRDNAALSSSLSGTMLLRKVDIISDVVASATERALPVTDSAPPLYGFRGVCEPATVTHKRANRVDVVP
jgi:hypothetical protein